MADSPWVVLETTRLPRDPTFPERLSRLLETAAKLAPPERWVITVLEQHEPWWRPVLDRYPAARVVEQHVDRGNAVALLLGALEVVRDDAHARAIFALSPSPAPSTESSTEPKAPRRLPSDLRHLPPEGPLFEAVAGEAAAFVAWLASLRHDVVQPVLFASATATERDHPDLLISSPSLPHWDLEPHLVEIPAAGWSRILGAPRRPRSQRAEAKTVAHP